MKERCAVLDDYQHVALSMADWTSLTGVVDIEVFHDPFVSEEDVVLKLMNFEIIVIMRERTPFPDKVLSRLPNLKLLITTGMRNASVDLSSAARHGIVVCGTESRSEPPVELTWALILGLARNIGIENNAFRTGDRWQSTLGTDLQGKTLGLLGLGKLGSRVARIAEAFGMNVLVWSQNLTAEQAALNGAKLAGSLEELLENSDFLLDSSRAQ